MPPPSALVAVSCSIPPPRPRADRRGLWPLAGSGKRLSWSKATVRKWFNIKTKAKDFHSDYGVKEVGMQWRTSFSERAVCKTKRSRTERLPRKNPDRDRRAGNGIDRAYITNTQDYRLNIRWRGDEAVEGGRGRRRFLAIWAASGLSWAFSSWRIQHFQANNLQWILALVPLIKALQMTLSLLFWSRRRSDYRYSCVQLHTCLLWILFQTASFISFMIISMVTASCASASPSGRDAQLRASDASSTLGSSVIKLHFLISTRFHGTMQVAAMAFIMVYMRADDTPDNCWF